MGFAYCYESHQQLVKFAPDFQLRRKGILAKRNPKRKAEKELKRKIKKSRGAERRKVLATRKVLSRADINKAKSDYLQKFIAA